MGRTEVDEHGRVRHRRIVVREEVDGFYGPVGSATIEDVTDEIEGIAETLDDDEKSVSKRIGEARGRLRRLLNIARMED